MRRYIVFDLDGTLANTLPGIAAGVNRALACLHRAALSETAVRGMIGRGARNLCAQAIGYPDADSAPADLLDEVHELFRREYPHCWRGRASQPYPGMADLLRELADNQAHLAVLSNKPHDVTLPMVQELFPGVPWNPVMGFSGAFPRKPAPDSLLHIAARWKVSAQDVTLVGDSLYDANTAQNAGCKLVLVSWGYAVIEPLEATGQPLVHSVRDLRELLLR